MFCGKWQKYQLSVWAMLLITATNLMIACQKEGSKSGYNQETNFQEQTKSLNLQTEITNAVLIQPLNSDDPVSNATAQATALLDSTSSQKLPAKLICIPNSLAYLGFVVDDSELSGFIQDNTININALESDLVNQCNSKLSQIGQENIQISKLGIRFQGRDFELTKTSNNLKPINIDLNFFNSLVIPENFFNITCKKNTENYNLGGKLYFNPDETVSSNNIVFINLSWSNFLSAANSFNNCKKEDLYLSSQQYKTIYFMNDTVSEADKFLTKSADNSEKNEDKSFLICYFVDEEKKLKWHWAFDSFHPIEKSLVTGTWGDGVFKTNTSKSTLQNKCTNFSKKYADGSWKLFDMQVADNVWSWGSQIIYNSVSTQSPYDKIVVFGDNIEENGSSKKYSGTLTGRVVSDPKYPYFGGRYTGGPTFSEDLANLFQIPLFNWANTKESSQEQQSSASPLTTSVNKYLADSNIWGGELTQNTLFVIHVGGNYFTNSQNAPDLYKFSNDLSNAIANLAKENAIHIALLDIVNPVQLAITPQQLNEVFDNVVKSSKTEYPNMKITKISVQDFYQNIADNKSAYGFRNMSTPCLTDSDLCDKQSQYFYFDDLYPGATANLTLALYAWQLLSPPYTEHFTSTDYNTKVFRPKNNPFLNLLLEKE